MKSIAFICGSEPKTGIYNGGKALFGALTELGFNVSWYQCTDRDVGCDLPSAKNIRGISFPNKIISMGINRFFIFPIKLRLLREEIIFLLDPTLVRIGLKRNTIVKIHDLRPLTKYRDKWLTSVMFRYAIPKMKETKHIITTTKYMKNELIKLGFNESKIHVIHDIPAISGDSEHWKISIERIKRGEINLLYVATDRPYKRVNFFIQLAEMFSLKKLPIDYNFKLVSNLTKKTKADVEKLNLKNLHVYSNVDNIEKIYGSTDILLFPSLYEGFGLPLLEALSMCIPVISSDLEPMREILGNAGILLPPRDLDLWKNSILSLSDAKAYEHAARSSFERYEAMRKKSYKEDIFAIFSQP